MKSRNVGTVTAASLLLASATLVAQSRQDLRDALANAPRDLPWTESNVRAKEAFNAGGGKIDPGFLAVAASVQSKGIDQLDTVAKSFSIPTEGEMVAVTLIAESEADVAKLRREVSQRGGRVTTTYKNQVFALMPPERIPSLGQVDELYAATRPEMFYGDQEDAKETPLADGVLKIRADRLHKAGVRGQGVKVGILDFGFKRYSELKASGVVPEPASAKAFTTDGRFENDVEHGTACAEIVHAMAPDAQLFLAAVDGRPDQIIEAARWLKAQGVDIISFSGGGHGGPHNGTDKLDQLVAEITRDHRTLWVNAAGNEGDRHILVNVPAGASGWIPIEQGSPFIAFAPTGRSLSIMVNWDDWGSDPDHPSATQDIDAFLFKYDKAAGKLEQVASSVTEQNGRMPPIEAITGEIPDGIYLLQLRATHVTKPVRVHVFSNLPALMQPTDPTGSVGIPATSAAALAVGAVDVTNGKLERYSSRGPTDDNRAKPELSSYDNVSSAAYGTNGQPGRFPGTSAACPHVAGLAALFKSQQHNGDTTALRNRLLAALRHPEFNDPGFGAGLTDVASLPDGGKDQSGKTEAAAGAIDLPEVFGGKVTAEALERLQRERPEQPFAVKVRLGRDGNPPEYHIGDDLRLGYTTAEDGYCALVNRDADGRYTPLPLDSGRLEAGKRYVYPDKIRVTAPTGSEEFLFICSKDRVDLNDWQHSSESGRVAMDVAPYEVKQ